ncbi:MAG: glycine zipper 2TM domain-containing protein [Rhodanobacter sp.]
MNSILINTLNVGVALVLAVGLSACNRSADAGITGNAASPPAGAAADSGAAMATNAAPSAQYAKVVSVTPVRRTSKVPKQVCRDETVAQTQPPSDEHNLVGTAIGAVAGGLLGNQVGGGKGKTLATVAGAVGGGYAGNRIEEGRHQANTTTSVRQHCETVETDGSSKVVAYDVSYVFNGVTRTTRMDHDPGDQVQVQVKENVTAVPVTH